MDYVVVGKFEGAIVRLWKERNEVIIKYFVVGIPSDNCDTIQAST